jgi:hypothetical protein
MGLKVSYPCSARPETRHQAGTGRGTPGHGTIGSFIAKSFIGNPVDIRTVNVLGSIAPQFGAKVINGDEENV